MTDCILSPELSEQLGRCPKCHKLITECAKSLPEILPPELPTTFPLKIPAGNSGSMKNVYIVLASRRPPTIFYDLYQAIDAAIVISYSSPELDATLNYYTLYSIKNLYGTIHSDMASAQTTLARFKGGARVHI